jgi:hypothetical protein
VDYLEKKLLLCRKCRYNLNDNVVVNVQSKHQSNIKTTKLPVHYTQVCTSIILRAWRSCSLDYWQRGGSGKMSLFAKQLQQGMGKKSTKYEIKDASSGKVLRKLKMSPNVSYTQSNGRKWKLWQIHEEETVETEEM